jgi:hypothetical protein
MIEEPTPDGVPCRHCGQPIFWDEVCWVHDNGFADCGLVIQGGMRFGSVILDPQMDVQGPHAGKRAEPVGDWS